MQVTDKAPFTCFRKDSPPVIKTVDPPWRCHEVLLMLVFQIVQVSNESILHNHVVHANQSQYNSLHFSRALLRLESIHYN